jgi:hypothetical protein
MAIKRNTAKNKRTRTTKRSHLRASLVYVAPHKHTGKRLAHRQTSHGLLLLLLIAAGIILFFSLAGLEAAGITRNGQVNVTLTVPGTPPSTGAVITSPQTKSKVKKPLLQVTGTCPSGNIAAVYNNGQFAGSTICLTDNSFQATVQLRVGINTLQAQNYDDLNQSGPATSQIEVVFEPDNPALPIPAVVNTADDITLDPSIPDTLAPQPSENPCHAPVDPEATTELSLTVSCVTRNIFVGEKISLPISVLGGIGPYALSVDWGEGDSAQLYSLSKPGHHQLSHAYSVPRIKNISLLVADSSGQTYQLGTVISINDDGSDEITAAGVSPFQNALNNLTGIWLEVSVPLYWAVVTLFLGFWVGDLFQRFLGTKKHVRRRTT